ncbi:hypothetical protein [Nostoc sp.]|uniref:hypothetical protein n=1 Tax=Nostoc sp. TaxID=1180 RepID=UPI002FFC26BD
MRRSFASYRQTSPLRDYDYLGCDRIACFKPIIRSAITCSKVLDAITCFKPIKMSVSNQDANNIGLAYTK